MTDREIVEMYLNIPESVRNIIVDDIRRQKACFKQNIINKYLSAMTDIVGEIPTRTRETKFVDARMVLSWVMHLDGYTEHDIAVLLKRDHSCIHYYITNMSFYIEHKMRNARTILLEKYNKKLDDYDIHR